MSSKADGRAARGEATRLRILDATRDVLVERGYSGTTTRAVAQRAKIHLSLVHYHFGGKQQLLVAVLERQNRQLLERQRRLYAEPGALSDKWRTACRFLDDDVQSGYVRVLWELWAAGLADPELAARWRAATAGWRELLESVFADWAADLQLEPPVSPRILARSSPTSSRESRSSCSPASPSPNAARPSQGTSPLRRPDCRFGRRLLHKQ